MKRVRRKNEDEGKEEESKEERPAQRPRQDEGGTGGVARGRGAVTADRASYFARGDTAGVEAEDITPAVAPAKEEWPGMFHTGAVLQKGRSAAQAKRQEELDNKDADADDAVTPWEPRYPLRALIKTQDIPSLRDLVCDTIAKHIHHFHDLGHEYLGERSLVEARGRIATLVAQRRRLDSAVLPFFVYPGVMEIDIPDCSMLDENSLVQALLTAQTVEKELHMSTKFASLKLGMSGRCISDRVLENLSTALSTVEDLRLDGCYRLSDRGIQYLQAKCSPTLETFELSSNQRITATSISYIQGWTHLHTLSLAECPQLVDQDFVPLRQLVTTSLRKLSLVQLDKATDRLLELLFADATDTLVEELSVARCSRLTDVGVQVALQACPRLISLDVADVLLLTDDTLATVRASNLTLQRVNLRRCTNITDKGIEDLVVSCAGHLERLEISSIPLLTGKSMVLLATHCATSLKHLDISFCRHIRDNDVGHLTVSCPNLTRLGLYGCTQISSLFLQGQALDDLVCYGHPLLTGLKLRS
ncbi:hypothetical protein H257_13716 [Aphanomyces astaci]|uniref:Uncharacterized protein n=2 Tax=Aphanomyces astaci TaxID=112090 RepID=W4FWE4_APHAT|nr:hypothetical protein H257_13716 [Aphanomyces astaci]ETV70983.1 hypothetical protein H257_13716 [Aphanomyces astaci]|eukprot:XP_009839646.1 hypothetical protein H257_13716 [Aphanomyces astaci]